MLRFWVAISLSLDLLSRLDISGIVQNNLTHNLLEMDFVKSETFKKLPDTNLSITRNNPSLASGVTIV